MPRTALLIEDESAARADLRAKLAAHPDITVVDEAATCNAARARLAQADYDLVFLDIQLIGGSAFELVPHVRPGARVVFVTAHDAFALRAFEVNALDYLLKPVQPARLAEALRRLDAPVVVPAAAETEATIPTASLRADDLVCLRTSQQARFAPVNQISLITAQDNYTEVQLADGARLLLRKPLKAWEDTLPASHFMRVHRTRIVNLARVQRYERDADEHTRLFVEGVDTPVAASRERWTELRDRLGALRPRA